jgi:regulator of PEP synthase PpsR (kinase-PPPase family)
MEVTDKKNNPIIFTLSDGTGETALSIVKAALAQFEGSSISVKRFNKIRTRESLESVLLDAVSNNAIVIATLVDHELRVYLMSRGVQLGVKMVDVLFPVLDSIASQLNQKPSSVPGLFRQLDGDYFKRIWAVEYTVRHDDGVLGHDIVEADIILVGVSRTSKTPLSIYLAHKGYKVANIPLVPNVKLPESLQLVDQNKVVGLIIDPDRLAEIRGARLQALGALNSDGDQSGDYANADKIFEELEWSREVFKQNRRWPVLDVTGKAIEENAVEIEKIILSRFPSLIKDN